MTGGACDAKPPFDLMVLLRNMVGLKIYEKQSVIAILKPLL
jgi:hypothetical protein